MIMENLLVGRKKLSTLVGQKNVAEANSRCVVDARASF